MAKMKNVTVRGYNIDDVPAMAEIWNEVVKEGNAFPQKETLDYEGAKKFFGVRLNAAGGVPLSAYDRNVYPPP